MVRQTLGQPIEGLLSEGRLQCYLCGQEDRQLEV